MQHPLLSTFPIDDPLAGEVAAGFGLGPFAKVSYSRAGPLANCYWNVDVMVQKYGGELVYGWQILTWPGRYVEALHHGVWRRTDGMLVDVTEKYATDTEAYSTFVPDDSIKVDLKAPPLAPSKYFVLMDLPEVASVIAIAKAQVDQLRQASKMANESGGEYIPGKGWAFKGPPPPQIQKAEQKVLDLRAQLGAAFDALDAVK